MAKSDTNGTELQSVSHTTQVQVIAQTQDGQVLDQLLRDTATRATDEAQLRVLVYETKQALRAELEDAVARLTDLSAVQARRKEAFDAAFKEVEVPADLQAEVDALLDAARTVGFFPKGTCRVKDYEPAKAAIVVEIEIDLIPNGYASHGDKTGRSVPAPATVQDAAAALQEAEREVAAQHKLVAALRAELSEAALREIEDEGRYLLDRKLVDATSDAETRQAGIKNIVSRRVAGAKARGGAGSGRKQLETNGR